MPKLNGDSDTDDGILGASRAPGKAGVAGVSFGPEPGNGIYGRSDNGGSGVFGTSSAGSGVSGVSNSTDGVLGQSSGAGKAGIAGVSIGAQPGNGVYGRSDNGGSGVIGTSAAGNGVTGVSNSNDGVLGQSSGAGKAGIAGVSVGPEPGNGIYGRSDNGGNAGWFDGNVHVTKSLFVDGDVVLSNADCAEDFDIDGNEIAEPGTVMVLGEKGALAPCWRAYDKRVAGVISGAGRYKPGIVLDKQPGGGNRSPVALLGKVYCKVDASGGAIEVGDLLTTSGTPGHAMKADDARQAFGSVIGKALRPLPEGRGLIPILIALQ